MIQCQDCELYESGSDGSAIFHCNPFTNIKEPECLVKWQLIKLDVIAKSHQATLEMHERLAPLQEKMIRHMEREIDDVEDADSWKYGLDDDDDDDDEQAPGF